MKNKFMQEAIKLARENEENDFRDGGPFGSVVVDRDGNIIGRGKNSVIAKCDATSHAEIEAIRDASRKLKTHDLKGCSIYTVGYPCPMCMSAILWANISKVYYANTLEDAGKIGFRDTKFYDLLKTGDDKILNIEQIKEDEALKVFDEYGKNSNKINY